MSSYFRQVHIPVIAEDRPVSRAALETLKKNSTLLQTSQRHGLTTNTHAPNDQEYISPNMINLLRTWTSLSDTTI